MGLGNEYPEADEASHRHLYELSQQRVKTLEEDRKYWRERAYSLDLEREQLSIDIAALRAELNEAQEQAQTARSEAAEDTALLDWLLQFITQNGANGIENMQWSLEDPEEIMEDRMGLVFDRKCIDAARHAAGTTEEGK